VAAVTVADRRYKASTSSPPPVGARIRQVMAAGLLTSLVGALFVTAAGFGTTAVMLKAAWLRDWLYHGRHLMYGVQNLSADLRTLPAIAYGHELTGSVDAGVFFFICIAFPVIALALTGLGALIVWGDAQPDLGDQRRGGGGPPGPEPAPAPDPPAGGRLAGVTSDDAGLPSRLEPGPGIEQDRLPIALADADAAMQPAGMR
jgi:hypothetical protein